MLKAIGAASVEELFFRYSRRSPHKGPRSARRHLRDRSARRGRFACRAQCPDKEMDWFLGAGAYYGYIPAVVPALAGRENSSPRTRPTSPRCPRGRSRRFSSTRAWRQNCSACRWSTPALRWRHGPRRSGADGLEGKGQPATDIASGGPAPRIRTSHRDLLHLIRHRVRAVQGAPEAAPFDEKTAAIVIAYPGFSGEVYPIRKAADRAHEAGALCIVQADPVMCALMKSPGEQGADIVSAEGQSWATPEFRGALSGHHGDDRGARAAHARPHRRRNEG